jgi:hypothetical protein
MSLLVPRNEIESEKESLIQKQSGFRQRASKSSSREAKRRHHEVTADYLLETCHPSEQTLTAKRREEQKPHLPEKRRN